MDMINDHVGEIAGYSDEIGDMLGADMENEREDEDSVCSPGDLPECRSGPPRRDQDPALCQAGVLGGPSQPQPSGRRHE